MERGILENCTDFSSTELSQLAMARGVVAALSCTTTIAAIVYIFIYRAFKTALQRLVLGLTLLTALHLLAMTLQVQVGSSAYCQATGFFVQYTASVGVLLKIGTVLYLWNRVKMASSLKKVQRHKPRKKSRKTEVLFFLFAVFFPLSYNWFPFLHSEYGVAGAWCWIRATNPDCSRSTSGLLYQVVLGYIPISLVAVLSCSLVAVTAWRYYKWAWKYRKPRAKLMAEAAEVSLLLAYLVSYAIFSVSELVIGVGVEKNATHNFGLWMTYAIVQPLLRALIPFSFLLYLYSTRPNVKNTLNWCSQYCSLYIHQRRPDHCQEEEEEEEEREEREESRPIVDTRHTQFPAWGMGRYDSVQPSSSRPSTRDYNPLYSEEEEEEKEEGDGHTHLQSHVHVHIHT